MDLDNLFQHFRISEAKQDASEAAIKAGANQTEIHTLQDQVDHLSLVCMAMCELMEDIGFNKSMLAAKIQEIDLRDGKQDRKLTRKKECPKCTRVVAGRHVKCVYCGTQIKPG